MSDETQPTAATLPSQIYKAFLGDLVDAKIPEDTISRLRKTLLEKPDLSEQALAEAVAPEETVP